VRKNFPLLLAVLTALAAVRLLLGARIGLIPDEAYYWSWSLRPDWCYWDQPGGIAWLHWAWGAVFGSSLVSLRALAVVCGLAGTLAAYGLVRRTLGERVAFGSALLLQVTPLFAIGSVMILHDSLFLPLAAAAWWAAAVALLEDKPKWWLAVGALLAAALYAKVAAAILGCGLGLAVLADPVGRRHLKTAWPYLGALLAAALFAPVIWWNAAHDWVMFHAVQRLAHNPEVVGLRRLSMLGDYVGGQLGVVTPVLAVIGVLAAGLAGKKHDGWRGARVLAVPALFVLAYFLANSFRAKIQANWPAIAWIGLLPLAVAWASEQRRSEKWNRWRAWQVGVGLAIFATLAVHVQALTGVVPLRPDITAQAFGWEEVAARVEQLRADGPSDPVLMTRSYQVAAELAYHLPDRPLALTVDYAHRGSQFTLWSDWRALGNRPVVWIGEDRLPTKFQQHFAEVERLPDFARQRGGAVLDNMPVFRARRFSFVGPEAAWARDPVGFHVTRMKQRAAGED
jgi:4-amino-4-deoxy-L-arabinose transferase-like glycosyltransferase